LRSKRDEYKEAKEEEGEEEEKREDAEMKIDASDDF
jgi:hypothetical protein